jgi:hypothetical protein
MAGMAHMKGSRVVAGDAKRPTVLRERRPMPYASERKQTARQKPSLWWKSLLVR